MDNKLTTIRRFNLILMYRFYLTPLILNTSKTMYVRRSGLGTMMQDIELELVNETFVGDNQGHLKYVHLLIELD